MKVTALTPLEDQLGCFGYFGFASGLSLALFGASDGPNGELYCNRCPKGQACWTRHKARVRTITPALCALADELLQTHHGPAYVIELCRRTGQDPSQSMSEPYLSVMMGNMEDGVRVAGDQPPSDRGSGSLAWPLVALT